LTYSSSFDNGAWVKYDTFVTSNIATSPSGVQDADKITPSTNNTPHNVDTVGLSVSNNGTASVYLKADGYEKAAVYSYFTNAYTSFDLINGTILTSFSTSASIEDAGNGWWRCTVYDTGNSSFGYVIAVLSNASNSPFTAYSGNGTDGILAWGAQLEVGSYPTSYIPTQGASVTRNADVISKTGISSLIGQTEGTMFYDGYFGNNSSEVYIFLQALGSGGVDNSIYLQKNANPTIGLKVFSGPTQVANINGGSFSVGDRIKIAAAYKANDFVLYINGTQIGTDTSGTPPTCANFNLGNYAGAPTNEDFLLNKGVNAAALWTTRLTNTQLAQLTTI
jgi:hypothetical protein